MTEQTRQFIADAEQRFGKPVTEFTWEDLQRLRAEELRNLDEANAGLAVTDAALAVREDLDR